MSTSTRRRAYHHGNLRPALIAEALRVLAEGNSAALSLRELARRLGVSHAAPYRHFGDKDALLAAIAEEGFQLLADALDQAATLEPDDPLGQLTATGLAYVRFALDHPHHFGVMFSSLPSTSPSLLSAGRRAFEVLVRTIQTGQQAGLVAMRDPRELATVAWAEVHGLVTLLLNRQLSVATDAAVEVLVRRCCGMLIDGLRS
jgi:AcrR family transcriptional regulator